LEIVLNYLWKVSFYDKLKKCICKVVKNNWRSLKRALHLTKQLTQIRAWNPNRAFGSRHSGLASKAAEWPNRRTWPWGCVESGRDRRPWSGLEPRTPRLLGCRLVSSRGRPIRNPLPFLDTSTDKNKIKIDQ